MADITPIRPDVKPVKRKPRDRDESLRRRIHGFERRLARAVALTRAMARAFQDQCISAGVDEIDAMDGMLGLADLLEHIQDDMVDGT